MKRLLYILITACALCACNNREAEPTGADFAYDRIAPLMYRFYNLSNSGTSFRWDFGDGMWSTGVDAAHTYEETGTYTVSLIATTESGYKYIHTETIEVTEPEVYIAGIAYYNIPYNNRYYKVIIKNDNLLPSSFDFQTKYTPLLVDSDLPYIYEFTTPRILQSPSTHNYYSVEVIRSTNSSSASSDISCMKQQLKVSDVLHYLPEYILQTESGSTAIGIIMDYRY